MATRKQKRVPVPGEIIRRRLAAVAIGVTAAAKALGVTRQMFHGILAGRRPLSPVMCLKLARLFGGSAKFWMRRQAEYELAKVAASRKVMAKVARIKPIKSRHRRSRR